MIYFIECNCSVNGSKGQNCTDDGVCECLKGFSGDKCDQCTGDCGCDENDYECKFNELKRKFEVILWSDSLQYFVYFTNIRSFIGP